MKLIDCSNSEVVYYQVQKQDDLNTILAKFSVLPNAVVRNNPNIDLYEGEVVKIVRNMYALHIVKPMETLDSISKKYDVDIDILIKDNSLTSKRLFIGQTLKIETGKNLHKMQ